MGKIRNACNILAQKAAGGKVSLGRRENGINNE
jgi:hypothetical protein